MGLEYARVCQDSGIFILAYSSLRGVRLEYAGIFADLGNIYSGVFGPFEVWDFEYAGVFFCPILDNKQFRIV